MGRIFRINKTPLPRRFHGFPGIKADDLVAEADIFPHPHGRLAAKLLVFRNNTALRRFWKIIGKSELGRGCRGVVNSLCHTRQLYDRKGPVGPEIIQGDGRYFCLIGLILGHLTPDILAHEAAHAGFAYHKRVKRNTWGKVGDLDEEQVCYPTGQIMGAINSFLHAKDLYNKKP